MKKKPEALHAHDLLDVVEQKQFPHPGHALLREVRNAVGWSRFSRSADGLVISLWPSRGVWFGGLEVKVERRDLLRELKDPAKSTEIQQYCNYWWLVTPPRLAKLEELPVTWGLIEVDGAKCAVVKQAPELKPEPLHPTFVAAVLRNRASYEASLVNETRTDTWIKARAELGGEENEKLQNQLARLKIRADNAEAQLAEQRAAIAEFERTSGVTLGRYAGPHMSATWQLALMLRQRGLAGLTRQLTGLVETLQAMEKESNPVAVPETGEGEGLLP